MGSVFRTIAGLLLAGGLAPLIFGLLLMIGSTPGSAGEFIGLLMIAFLLGSPFSIGAAIVGGLPGIYFARCLGWRWIWVFAAAGSALALGATAWLAHGDIKGWTDWIPFALIAAVTGSLSGIVCWMIAERPLAKGTGPDRCNLRVLRSRAEPRRP